MEKGFNNTHSVPGHFNSLEIAVAKFKDVWSRKYLEKTGNDFSFSYKIMGQIKNLTLRMYKEIKEQNEWFNLGITANNILDNYFDNNEFWFTQKKNGFKDYNIGHLIKNFDAILNRIVDEKKEGK